MLVPFGFFAAGIALIVVGIAQRSQLVAARRWATVDGEILAARVIEDENADGGKRYEPDIQYAYTVDGVRHLGTRRQLIVLAPLSRAYAEGIVQRYAPGSRATVYYDPGQPRDAVLEIPTTSALPLVYTAAGLGLSIFGVYKWWHLN